jgi:3',5'-nucleoside bisphosphate phosphatase
MVIYSLMKNTIDMHVHTLVSDGNAMPMEMLAAAHDAGLTKLSFCDHDALGAYRHWGDMFALAKGLGIELVPGIELDTYFADREVHLLGYGFDLDDAALNRHLERTQKLRKERVMLQLAIVNRFFGRQVIDLEQVLFPLPSLPRTSNLEPRTSVRDTLMKPHMVHAMLEQGLFSEYRAANYWLSQNAQVPVVVPKLPLADAIAMVCHANGEAVLAHPGYLVRENGFALAPLLQELVALGLAGIEVDYPYYQEKWPAKAFPDKAAERAMIDELRALAVRFKLKATRGSDAHDAEALRKFAIK